MESFFVCWDLVRSISLAKDQKIQSDLGVWRHRLEEKSRIVWADKPAES